MSCAWAHNRRAGLPTFPVCGSPCTGCALHAGHAACKALHAEHTPKHTAPAVMVAVTLRVLMHLDEALLRCLLGMAGQSSSV